MKLLKAVIGVFAIGVMAFAVLWTNVSDGGGPIIPPPGAQCLAVNPNGKTIALARPKGTIQLWDIAKKQTISSLSISNSDKFVVNAMAFTPDGKSLAIGSRDQDLQLWDVATGKLRMTYVGRSKHATAVVFSNDGRTLFSAGSDVQVWETDTGKQLAALPGHAGGVHRLALADQSKVLAASAAKGGIKLWNAATYKELASLESPFNCEVALSPDGKQLLSCCGQRDVAVWSVATKKASGTYQTSRWKVAQAQYSGDGKLVVGMTAYSVHVWDADTAIELINLPIDYAYLHALTPDGKTLIAATYGGEITAWDLSRLEKYADRAWKMPEPSKPAKARPLQFDSLGDPLPTGAIARLGTLRMGPLRSNGPCAAISPDGKSMATTNGGLHVSIWDLASSRVIRKLEGPGSTYWQQEPVFSSDGTMLAAAFYADGPSSIVLWDFASGKELIRLPLSGSSLSGFTFADGENTVVALERTGLVRRWDAKTGKAAPSWDPLQKYRNVIAAKDNSYALGTFSRDGNFLVVDWRVDRDRVPQISKVLLLNLADSRELWQDDQGEGKFSYASFSGNGQVFAFAVPSRRLEVRETATGKLLQNFNLPNPSPSARPQFGIVFSPDGKWLVAHDAEHAGLARVWSLATGKEQFEFPLGAHPLSGRTGSSLVFFPDSRRLLVIGNNQLHNWEMASGKESLNLPGHREAVVRLQFSADGKQLQTGTAGPNLKYPYFGGWAYPLESICWDSKTWGQTRRTLVPNDWPLGRPVAASPDHKLTVTANPDRTLKLRSFPDDKALREIGVMAEKTWEPNGLISPDGKFVIVRDNGNTCVIDMDSGNLIGQLPVDTGRKSLVFDHKNHLIAWLTNDYRIGIFDHREPTPVRYLKTAHGGFEQLPWHPLVFTSDGLHVAEWDHWAGAAKVFDLKTGKLLQQIPRVTSPYIQWSAECMAFSPDDKLIAFGGITENESVIAVWDVASNKLLRQLEGHHSTVKALAWSPDGKLLASGSSDSTALIWDVSDLGDGKRDQP